MFRCVLVLGRRTPTQTARRFEGGASPELLRLREANTISQSGARPRSRSRSASPNRRIGSASGTASGTAQLSASVSPNERRKLRTISQDASIAAPPSSNGHASGGISGGAATNGKPKPTQVMHSSLEERQHVFGVLQRASIALFGDYDITITKCKCTALHPPLSLRCDDSLLMQMCGVRACCVVAGLDNLIKEGRGFESTVGCIARLEKDAPNRPAPFNSLESFTAAVKAAANGGSPANGASPQRPSTEMSPVRAICC